MPASSVCGLYFAHPAAKYFSVGKIGRDQVEEYAGRKVMPIEELEREEGAGDVIKLASNENPLGPSPMAMDAVRAALADPDVEVRWEAAEALARIAGPPEEESLPR